MRSTRFLAGWMLVALVGVLADGLATARVPGPAAASDARARRGGATAAPSAPDAGRVGQGAKPAVSQPFRRVAPGIELAEVGRRTPTGPLRVYALKLDPRQVSLEPTLARPAGRFGLAPVSQLARAGGAIAAMNAGFFSWRSGAPQGTLVMDGCLVSRALRDRPALWIRADGSAYIAELAPAAAVHLEDGTTLRCAAVNEDAKRDRMVLYTSHFGATTGTVPDPSRWECALDGQGRVVAVGAGDLAIPRGGFVVSAQGRARRALRHGTHLARKVGLGFGLGSDIRHALGGNLVLVRNGTLSEEVGILRTLPAPHREPRTAFGITAEGDYLLICVDGRRPGHSVGATYVELAEAVHALGAVDALNLDGGGSTTLWLGGRVVNKPSEGSERAVGTAFLVKPRAWPALAGRNGLLDPSAPE